jgi:hypothetical protein
MTAEIKKFPIEKIIEFTNRHGCGSCVICSGSGLMNYITGNDSDGHIRGYMGHCNACNGTGKREEF